MLLLPMPKLLLLLLLHRNQWCSSYAFALFVVDVLLLLLGLLLPLLPVLLSANKVTKKTNTHLLLDQEYTLIS